MGEWRRASTATQLTEYLRAELVRGRWRGTMPGVIHLANELGLARNSVEAAMHELEREGLLRSQGRGRGRIIDLATIDQKTPGIRVAILLSEPADRHLNYLIKLTHLLEEAGHAPFSPTKTQENLGTDVKRLARFVRRTEADAWVVIGGSSDVLKWFTTQQVPVFGLFGRIGGLPMAGTGPDKSPAYAEVVKWLVAHGHHRIVLLARPQRRNPQPIKPPPSEWVFLRTLEKEGIEVSDYNFPDWDNTKEGFHRCLESLFQLTSPTALIVQESLLFAAVQQFLATRDIQVPQDISLVCADPDPTFAWQEPSVTHITWDSDRWVRRIIRWVANVKLGKEDRRQALTKTELVMGGTIGPARR